MGQLYQSGLFQKYDYGFAYNYGIYLDNEPPVIDLSKIKVPVAMWVAGFDHIADVKDNQRLRKELPNVVDYTFLPDEDHLSLTFSKNLTYFHETLRLMDKYKYQMIE